MKLAFTLAVSIFALTFLPSPAEARPPCLDDISYPTLLVENGTSESVSPVIDFDCGEIDDPRSFSIVNAPSFVTINSFNGRVTASPTIDIPPGTLTYTVNWTWSCSCANNSGSLQVTIEIYGET
jgi:hypothetical protein